MSLCFKKSGDSIKKTLSLSIEKYTWLFLPILALILMLSFWNPEYVIRGHDTELHLSRIVGFVEAIKAGQIPAKVYPNAMNGFGYGWGIFYPPLSVIVPGSFVLLGLDLDVAFKLFLWLTISLAGISMYRLVMDISGSKEQSLVTSILYITCPYFLTDVIIRSAVGEMLVFVFLPVLFRGLFHLLYGERSKSFWIAIGFAGLAFSHIIGLVLSVLVSGVFLLLNICRIWNWDVIKRLVVWCLVSVVLSASFLVPLMEHLLCHEYNVEKFTDNEFVYQMAVYPSQLFSSTFLFGASSMRGEFSEMPLSLGLLSLSLLVSGILVIHSLVKHKLIWFYVTVFLLLGITIFMSTVYFPWDKAGALGFVQYPWRFLLFSTFFICLLSGWIFSELSHNHIQPLAIAFLSFICLAAIAPILDIYTENDLFFKPRYADYQNQDFMQNEGNTYNTVFLGNTREYFPTGLDEDYLRLRGDGVIVMQGNASIDNFVRKGNQINFSIKNSVSSVLELPLIYYDGYQVLVTDQNGKQYELSTEESINHLVNINIGNVTSGQLHVEYKGTLAGRISYYVSVIAMAVFLVYLLGRSNIGNITIREWFSGQWKRLRYSLPL